MKSILISIRPEWVAKILNGEKTIEIRKSAPKCNLPIDVYIYCTKTIKPLSDYDWGDFTFDDLPKLGKVVGKFRLKKVDKFDMGANQSKNYQTFDDYKEILKGACLSKRELEDYLGCRMLDMACHFYAWHISDLEIFDKPRELDEFDYPNPSGIRNIGQRSIKGLPSKKHPPQSWCYVEVKE